MMSSIQTPWIRKSSQYEKVDESEDDISVENDQPSWHRRYQRLLRTCQLSFVLNVVLLILGIFFYISNRVTVAEASKLLSTYSLFTESNVPRLKDTTVRGTLYPSNQPSFSRAEPGDLAAEAIWESLEHSQMVPVTREQLIKMGKDPSTAVKFPDSIFGLGDDAYIGSLDVQHKVHCLNELRKSAFARYPTLDEHHYFSGTDHDLSYRNRTHSKLWWLHLRHCVDILAQDLICHADSELMTYTWRDNDGAGPVSGWDGLIPFPDMSINRKCRDWDQLIKWQDERKVDIDLYVNELRYDPNGDTKLVPNERQHYEKYGFEDSVLFPNGEGFEEYFASAV